MKIQENKPLAPFTTLGVGGSARFFIEVKTAQELEEAVAFAHKKKLPLFVLGKGSNVLIPDEGIAGVVVKIGAQSLAVVEQDAEIRMTVGAGVVWDDVVDEAGKREVFGLENLAGIPGSLGGAVVQNIGAYGAEFSQVFLYADVVDSISGKAHRIESKEAMFAYRTSFFKQNPHLLIFSATLRLLKGTQPNTSYADLARAQASGTPLATPKEIASAVRAIRAKKFPKISGEGTAGSFFKNPSVSREKAEELTKRFPGLPTFPQENGTLKLPLAWILDSALSLKGYTHGRARLYEEHPLVIVAGNDATAKEVEELAQDVAKRVFEATGITIEREVETFGAQR